MKHSESIKLFNEATKYMPGGVSSPVRAFSSVGMDPLFIEKGEKGHVIDVDGNEFIDYVGSYGPLVLGHNHPDVLNEVISAAKKGAGFGSSTKYELALCKLITSATDFCDMVRLVNSGTEATMSAIRLARAYTGRDKIIKFEGCYHGHSDALLIKAGSGALTFNTPSSPGVPMEYGNNTLIAKYNDLNSVEKLFNENKDSVAAIIIEPVAGNMGVIKPEASFLKDLLKLTHKNGALFIADEVMTGFRLSFGGACGLFDIVPDIVTYGKIIGGGLPVGAYGGRRDIMELVAPVGPMYQAGTLSGNPLTASAGIATLTMLKNNPEIYNVLENKGQRLETGIKEILAKKELNYTINRCGSMITLFMNNTPVRNYDDTVLSDTNKFADLFKGLIKSGVYIPPSQFESMFISYAHTDDDIEQTLRAFEKSL